MKTIKDFQVVSSQMLNEKIVLLRVRPADGSDLLPIAPGQFVELRIDNEPTVFLRRPISIHYVDRSNNEIWLLVQVVGDGSRHLSQLRAGDVLNMVYPLGNGFTLPDGGQPKRCLLVGGGVGIAPLLDLGAALQQRGHDVVFLLGARRAADLVQLDEFRKFGAVYVTTEDGSQVDGCPTEQGFVTNHSVLQKQHFDCIRVCGPKPMMMAVACFARTQEECATARYCEVSLENKMACGLGVCLCCVEDTRAGHKCVCSEGPVFDINDLKWE
jgi:dihydroorotate dehydrogenase electron transfer subunit